jgi:rhodanese-related sulfurtransferase
MGIVKEAFMKPLKNSVKAMVAAAREKITEYSVSEVIPMLDQDDVVIVDIRDIRERQKLGFIPGSFHAPRGMLEFWIDPDSPYFKDIFAQDKRFILHCASGWRSALSTATLQDMGFEAAHITEGFNGWVDARGPVAFPDNKTS